MELVIQYYNDMIVISRYPGMIARAEEWFVCVRRRKSGLYDCWTDEYEPGVSGLSLEAAEEYAVGYAYAKIISTHTT